MRRCSGIVLTVLAVAACDRAPEPKRYEVRGQIVSFDPQRKEVVVDHEDIEGFMPAMVMPYKVQDLALLEGKQPGDMVTATLVVEEVSDAQPPSARPSAAAASHPRPAAITSGSPPGRRSGS